jgi:hypothetical protein
MKRIELQDIEIPVSVEDFITPDWKTVLDFHTDWKAKIIKQGGEPWAFQPYFLAFLKKLVATGHRSRTEQQWTNRIFDHFGGLDFFETYQKRDWDTPGGGIEKNVDRPQALN